MKEEMIEHLCRLHTSLDDEDIQFITQIAAGLPGLAAGDVDADYFIDVPCTNPSEVVVVAWASAKASLYEFSTVGYIILEDAEPAVFRSLRLGTETEEVRAITAASTRQHFVVQAVRPLKRGDRTIGALISERAYQNSEKQKDLYPCCSLTEQDLSRAPYLKGIDWLADQLSDGVIVVDERGQVLYRNAKAAQIYSDYGYIYDIMGRPYWKVACHTETKGDSPEEAEISIRGRYYHITQRRMTRDGYHFVLIILRDVTDNRRMEAAENFRITSLHEAHHRIKNSLNMVYSLLDMQRRRCKNETAAESLKLAMDRVLSMAGAYEIAAGSAKDEVSLFQALIQLADRFTKIARESDKEVNITVQGNDLQVPANAASTILLVVTELLQNCLKHAFAGRTSGNIHIELSNSTNYSELAVSDDGVGFPENPVSTGNEMGIPLMRMLVNNSLGGRLDYTSGRTGTRASFSFLYGR